MRTLYQLTLIALWVLVTSGKARAKDHPRSPDVNKWKIINSLQNNQKVTGSFKGLFFDDMEQTEQPVTVQGKFAGKYVKYLY